MYRDVTELTRDELKELKENYLIMLAEDGTFAEVVGRDYDDASWGDLADADEIVPDDVIFENYRHCTFVEEDFFCNKMAVGQD